MEGYLMKSTSYFSTWKKRYFVLKDNIFYYYKEKGGELRGRLHLSISQIKNYDPNDLRFELDSGLTSISLKAENKKERDNWITKIKNTKAEYETYEKEFVKRNTAIFGLEFGNVTDEIDNLQSKLHVIKTYIAILNNLNDKICELVQKKNCEEEIINVSQENKKEYEHVLYEVNKIHFYLEKQRPSNQKMVYEKVSRSSILNSNPNILTSPNKNDKILKVLEENHIENYSPSKENKTENNDNSNVINIMPVQESTGNKETVVVVDKKENINLNIKETVTSKKESVTKTEIKPVTTHKKDLKFDQKPDLKEDETGVDIVNIVKNLCNVENFQPMNWKNDSLYITKRQKLPFEKKNVEFSVWGLLKDALSKELSQFSTPVFFNEPISMLQRLAENFQYCELLNYASNEKNPFKRLAYISAFNVSAFGFNTFRTLKSFNPILGETYEYIDNDLNFKFIAEQVSHHPPVSACHVQGTNFDVFSNNQIKTKFNLFKGALIITPASKSIISMKNLKEFYSYSKPTIFVRGLIFGKMRIDCNGKCEVHNNTTGDIATMDFLEEGLTTKVGTIKGDIKNAKGEVVLKIEGNWQSHFDLIYPKVGDQEAIRETLWKRTMDENADEESHYYFTKFVANLNNLTEELKQILPITDSRFRKDQRALEEQDYDFAEDEKKRLEQKQREARKQRELDNKKYEPIYFREIKDEKSGETLYVNSRDYWKDRENKDFSLPNANDIFS